MISTTLIRELAEKKLLEGDSYLVDVTVSASNKIRVTIDNFRGISIQECVTMSRWIENQLDREQHDFELEVTSPGLDQPFKVLKQYEKNIGREVEVIFSDGQKTEGKLLAASENAIELEQELNEKKDNKKGKSTTKQVDIPFENIKETRIIIKF